MFLPVSGQNLLETTKPRHKGGVSICAPGGIRTPNLLIRSQMLYPLSPGRIALCTLLNVTALDSVMHIRVIQSPEIRLASGFPEHQVRDTRPPRDIVDPNSRTFIRGTTGPTMHKARRPSYRSHRASAEVAGFEPAMGLPPKPA